MTKNKFTAEQVVRILQEAESGQRTVTDICRDRGITKNTFYAWKKKYGGMDVQDSRRLRELERENGRLKRLLAERDLEIDGWPSKGVKGVLPQMGAAPNLFGAMPPAPGLSSTLHRDKVSKREPNSLPALRDIIGQEDNPGDAGPSGVPSSRIAPNEFGAAPTLGGHPTERKATRRLIHSQGCLGGLCRSDFRNRRQGSAWRARESRRLAGALV